MGRNGMVVSLSTMESVHLTWILVQAEPTLILLLR